MQKTYTLIFLLLANFAFAQKKPLDHTVYDTWESISSKQISNNGQWIGFTIAQQEGDAKLQLVNVANSNKVLIPRAGMLQFSTDSKFAAFLIKPFNKDTRLGKIKKKKADELPKDSLGFINLTTNAVQKVARVKSFKLPENGGAMLAYLLEKPDTAKKVVTPVVPVASAAAAAAKKDSDFLSASPYGNYTEQDFLAADDKDALAGKEGTELVFRNLVTGVQRSFKYVSDYKFSKNGKQLVLSCTGSKKDKTAPVGVFLLNTEKGTLRTLVRQKGTFKNFVFDEPGEHLAFLGETGPEKQEIKNYSIYYSSPTIDTAQLLVENDIPGMPAKYVLSEDGDLVFSKDATKLYFGIAPLKKAKDTTLVDFEHAKLDIWGYKDDYLQPMQLKNAEKESKRNYLSVIDIYNSDPKIVPLADLKLPEATIVNQGDATFVLASTDYGNRVSAQWTGSSARDYYLVDVKTGARKKILSGISGYATASPLGNFVLYFDKKDANWYSYNVATGALISLTKGLNVKFADELNDVPDEPSSYSFAGWFDNDKTVLIYDRYDIWAFAADGKGSPKNITNNFGRQNSITLRYQKLDPEEKSIKKGETAWLDGFNNLTKEFGYFRTKMGDEKSPELAVMAGFKYSDLVKAKDAERFVYDKANYTNSPNVYTSTDLKSEVKLSETNPQQKNYNWGTAELFKWTTPKGFKSEGILYKPENFDPSKKYPMIVYFYEKLSDGLYTYQAPAPTPSRLNISYFVSNGYLVFAPDISYEVGYPGRSAVEFVNSGVESLKKNNWVDGSKIGIQGQSWGGYQVAYLITQTNMYAAAWAGAPVVNMTSAYGGVRWESGMSRQFQYERTQSRIGATLWEKPQLYIENSPLFFLPKVSTPVVIMSNDADGAVPYYQGIEMFTALKRLGKPSWLLVYNGEAHNLIQRQNRKDISIREQQFFDYYLKGAKAPVWMVSGVPATEKDKNWGFDLTPEKP
jgi:dipeptidyl aminopeptidase/acylaminoacyl peptidase